MNRIRLMPDYDALLVPKQIAIITESVQALNDICVSLETENAAIRMAAEQAEQIRTAAEADEWIRIERADDLPKVKGNYAAIVYGLVAKSPNYVYKNFDPCDSERIEDWLTCVAAYLSRPIPPFTPKPNPETDKEKKNEEM